MGKDKETLETVREDISLLVNTSIGSAKIHKLTVEENKKEQILRPSLHTCLGSTYGKLKSTIQHEVSEITKQKIITEITKAGLVGSVEAKEYVTGQAWDSRNNLMQIDEFDFGARSENWTTFLQLLEDQQWNRRLAIYHKNMTKTDGDLSFHIAKGKIEVKTRFSALITTMRRFELMRGDFFKAFVTRVVPRNYNINSDGLKRVANGEKIFFYQEANPNLEVIISNKNYNRILESVASNLINKEASINEQDIQESLLLRTIGDCCRYFAVWNKIDESTIKKFCDWKFQGQISIGAAYRHKNGLSESLKTSNKELLAKICNKLGA